MVSGTNSSANACKLPSRIWDAHVHCYPREVIADPAGWARQMKESHWLNLVTQGPQGWADPEALLRTMDRDGIEKVLLQGWYWENPESARWQNEWHARWLAAYPDRFLACAALHPDLQDPVATLEEARRWGACGVGECLPDVQHSTGWTHPAWADILEWTTQAGWLIGLHVTEPVGHVYPGRFETSLMEVVEIFERFPDQKWLCAHWGGGLPFYQMNRRVRKALRNVWFDSAAGPLLYDKRIWKTVVDLLGAGKVVLGSDFPLRLYPSRQTEPGWRFLLDELRASGLAAAALEQITFGNLKSLLE